VGWDEDGMHVGVVIFFCVSAGERAVKAPVVVGRVIGMFGNVKACLDL